MQSRENKLILNILNYTVGNIGSKIIGMLLVPVSTFFLCKKDIGLYDMLMTSTFLIVPLISLQIYDGAYRSLIGTKDDLYKQKIISTTIISISLIFLVFLFIFIPIRKYYAYTHPLIIIFLFASQLFLLSFKQIVRGLGNTSAYAQSGIIYSFTILLTSLLFLYIRKDANALIYGANIAGIFTCIYLLFSIKIHRYFKINQFSFFLFSDLAKYSIPLIPNTISWWLLNSANRFIILKYLGAAENGIFAVAMKLPSIIFALNSIFYLAWQDSSISSYTDSDRAKFYTTVFSKLVDITFLVAVFLIAVNNDIMKLVVSSEFYPSRFYVPFLYVGASFSSLSSFYGTAYLASKKTINAFYTTLFGGILSVIISILFVNKIGLYSIVIGFMIGYLLVWIIRIIQLKDLGIIVKWPKFAFWISILVIEFILFFQNGLISLSILRILAVFCLIGLLRKAMVLFGKRKSLQPKLAKQ